MFSIITVKNGLLLMVVVIFFFMRVEFHLVVSLITTTFPWFGSHNKGNCTKCLNLTVSASNFSKLSTVINK